MDEDVLDFVLLAWREDGRWEVTSLPRRSGTSLPALVQAARMQPSDAGAIAVVSVDEDFFVAVRVHGTDERVLLSDVTAAFDWPLAREAVDHAGLAMPEDDDDLDGVVPAGDLNLFADLGTDAAEIDLICADLELLPDEALARIAAKAGFGDKFDLALETLPD